MFVSVLLADRRPTVVQGATYVDLAYVIREGSSLCLSVCLSVTKCIMAKRYILRQKYLNKWIGSAPRNTILQLSTVHLPYPFKLPTLMPSGEYIKSYCEQTKSQNFYVWICHCLHAAPLFQTTSYDRLILSNSWATCYCYFPGFVHSLLLTYLLEYVAYLMTL